MAENSTARCADGTKATKGLRGTRQAAAFMTRKRLGTGRIPRLISKPDIQPPRTAPISAAR